MKIANITSGTAFSLCLSLMLGLALESETEAQVTSRSFGAFSMDFVTIGNPGNAADTTGYGTVAATFLMGKHEVSRDMITKANSAGSLGITLADLSAYGGNGVDRPATGVSWNEAARFVNWLNVSGGYSPAYRFSQQPGDGGYGANASIELWVPGDAGFNAANPYRNANAVYFLPSENEWYKAAYYSPDGIYYEYPTGSDTVPTGVASGTSAGTAVCGGQSGPADIGNTGGVSPYGTMGQGGNAMEWNENAHDDLNNTSWEARSIRGGTWQDPAVVLGSPFGGGSGSPTIEFATLGFRVAATAVPEPQESAGVIGLAALGFALWRRWGSC